jgi:hypothetical protein
MKYIYIFALLVQGPLFAERIKFVHKPQLSFDEQSKKWHVKFEMDSLSDVEVAMVARWLDDYPSSCRGVLGPPALRRYDVDGNYLRTLFPKAPSGTPQTYDVLFGAFETNASLEVRGPAWMATDESTTPRTSRSVFRWWTTPATRFCTSERTAIATRWADCRATRSPQRVFRSPSPIPSMLPTITST